MGHEVVMKVSALDVARGGAGTGMAGIGIGTQFVEHGSQGGAEVARSGGVPHLRR